MNENIDIKVREDGSREAAVRIRAVGTAADQAADATTGLNRNLNITRQAVQGAGQASQTASQQLQQMGNNAAGAAQQVQQLAQNSASFSQQLTNFAIGATAINVVTDAIGGLLDKLMEIPRQTFEAVRSLTELQAQVDKLRVGFKFGAGGDTFLGGANAEFINNLVQKLGLNLDATANSFLKFSAATRDTALQGEKTREIFTAVSEAATVLHLNAEQTQRTFLALEQMASKGVVSMEELRRQLGDNLPGAFQIAARAMGMSTAELDKAIRSGTVLAEDFLPKFAEQIRKEFGGSVVEASESAQASLGRLDSAWTNFKRTIADSGLGQAAKEQLDILTEAINGVSQAMGRAKSEGAGFWGQFGAGLKSFGQWFVLGEQNSDQGLAGRIKAINEELKRVDLDKFQRTQMVFDRDQAQKELQRRNAGKQLEGTGDTIQAALALANQENAAVEAARAAAMARVNKYNEGDSGKYLTKQQRLDKALETIQSEFKAATKDIDANSKEFQQAVNIAAARKQEAIDKFNAAGVSKANAAYQNQLAGELAVWKGYADQRVKIEQTAIADLQQKRNEGEISEKEYLRRVGEERDNSLNDQIVIAEKQMELAAGRKSIAERERYASRIIELEEMQRAAFANTAAALSDLDRKTRTAGENGTLQLMAQGDARGRAAARELNSLSQGSEQNALQRQIDQATDRAEQARTRLEQTAQKYGTKDSDSYRDSLALIDAEQQSQIEKEKQYFAVRMQMQADWSTGATKALNDYAETAANVAKSTQDVFTSAFSGMEDALTTFVTTGKLNFEDLTKSIIADLVKIQIRILLSQALSSLFGSALGMQMAPTAGPSAPGGYEFSSGSLAGTGAWQTGGYTGSGPADQIAGLVHKGEYVIKADVVNQPGMMGFLENLNSNGTPTPVQANGGQYGASSGAAAGVAVALNVEIINNAGDKVEASAQQGQDDQGNPKLEVLINALEPALAGRISQGRGPLYGSIKKGFGLQSNTNQNG